MNIEAKIRAVWSLNCETSRNDLLFHGQSDGSKSKFLGMRGLVVLISSSIGESSGSKFKICETSRNDLFHGQSDGSKSKFL